MYNVVNKILSFVLLSVLTYSCGNSDKDLASRLSAEAEGELKAGQYENAIELLDSLDTTYPKEVDIRRSAMKFRAMAIEALTIKRITVVDDTLALLNRELERLGEQFEYVKNPGKGLGGDYTYKSIVKSKYDIIPRVNDEGYYTLSLKISNKSIDFRYIRFINGASSVITEPIKSDRLFKVENNEMTVLQQEDVEQAVEWLKCNEETSSYQLVGEKATVDRKLDKTLYSALVTTWDFARVKQAIRQYTIEREKLERKLLLCRDQLANLIDK